MFFSLSLSLFFASKEILKMALRISLSLSLFLSISLLCRFHKSVDSNGKTTNLVVCLLLLCLFYDSDIVCSRHLNQIIYTKLSLISNDGIFADEFVSNE